MDNIPFFSIILPVYNAAEYLNRCIDSILIQKKDNFELILINDGSSDISGEICDAYANQDNRIKVIHKKNEGVSVARNTGLENAQGKWILFVDADDWVEPNWLDVLNSRIEIFDLDLYVFGSHRTNGIETEYTHLPTYTVEKTQDFVKTWYYKHAVWAYLFKYSIIKKYNIRFPENQPYSEDQAFLLKYMSVCDKIVLLNKALYNYYNNPSSVANKPISLLGSICNIWAANDFLQFYNQNNIPESFCKYPVRQLYEDFFMYYQMIANVDKKESLKEYKKAYNKTLQLYPEFRKYTFFKLANYNLSLPETLYHRKKQIKNKLRKVKRKLSLFSKLKKMLHNMLHFEKIAKQITDERTKQIGNELKYNTAYQEYNRLSKESTRSGISSEKYFNNEVIVSLTTYGRRIYDIYLTIESLMNQTVKPNKIILWIAEDEFTEDTLPITLKRLIKRGLTIEFCEDIKSYKKLVPALRKYPEDIIITVDDDALYQYDLVENLLNSYKENPKVIHFFRGHRMKIDKNGKLLSYNEWDWLVEDNQVNKLNFATGIGGILYPPHCLHKDAVNARLFMSLAPMGDDIWFKAMALLNGTHYKKAFTHHKQGLDCTEINEDSYMDTGLFINNNSTGKNDEQIKAVFSNYDLYNLINAKY